MHRQISLAQGLLLLGLIMSVSGCALKQNRTLPSWSGQGAPVVTTDLLLGHQPHPEKARAAARSWKRAVDRRDNDWLEGLEQRYNAPLTRLALALALNEDGVEKNTWGSYEKERLYERLGITLTWRDMRSVNAWKKAILDNEFEEAGEIALGWKADTATEIWLCNRAQALALFHGGRFTEAANLLDDSARFGPTLSRKNQLLRAECLRRAGNLDHARGAWLQLADAAIENRDDSLCVSLLDMAEAMHNLSATPLDKGRIVTLAERAESFGDYATAFRAFDGIWSDPRLSLSPEVMAARSPTYRRAGLGTLRYIAGGSARGDHAPSLNRWLEALDGETQTPTQAACACELKRLEAALFMKQHQLARALGSSKQAADLAELTGDASLIARSRGDLAVVQANCGEMDQALANCEAAGRAAEASGDEELLFETARNRLMLITGMSGQAPPERLHRQLVEQAKKLGRLTLPDV